jgi:hypothetical protein
MFDSSEMQLPYTAGLHHGEFVDGRVKKQLSETALYFFNPLQGTLNRQEEL